MLADSQVFWLPRRGNSPAEYEDACAVDDRVGRYAVADGASEGCFTDLWARLLVEHFVACTDCVAGQWPASLDDAQRQWDADVRLRELPWYADLGVEQGAHAAFIGLTLKRSAEPETAARPAEGDVCAGPGWEAVAVGDTCLFHTRNNVLLRAFPLEHSQQFNTVPQLLGARMTMEQVRMRRRVWSNGRGRADDRLWMMTDALAQWCLAEAEAGGNPWHELESLLAGSRQSAEPPSAGTGPGREGAIGCRADPGMDAADSGMGAATGLSSGAAFQAPGNSPVAPDDHFSSWIGARRRSGRLRNDDVTLVAILL